MEVFYEPLFPFACSSLLSAKQLITRALSRMSDKWSQANLSEKASFVIPVNTI